MPRDRTQLFLLSEGKLYYLPCSYPLRVIHTPIGRAAPTWFCSPQQPCHNPSPGSQDWFLHSISCPNSSWSPLFLHLHAPFLLHRLTHLTETFFSFLVISSFGAAHLQLTSKQQHLQSPQTHHGAATFFFMQSSAKTSRSCRPLALRMPSTLPNYKGGNKLIPSGQSWIAGKRKSPTSLIQMWKFNVTGFVSSSVFTHIKSSLFLSLYSKSAIW